MHGISAFFLTGKSTDGELLDLMLELAQTQVGMATQPTQSAYQTPTVAHSFCNCLKKSLSFPRASPSRSHHPLSSLSHSQPLTLCENHNTTGFTGLATSKPDSTTGSVCCRSDVGASEDMAAMQLQDVNSFLTVGENLLGGNSDEKDSTSRAVVVTVATKTADVSSSQPNQDSKVRVGMVENLLDDDLPIHLPRSPIFSDSDLFDTDLEPPHSLPPHDPQPEMVEGATSSELEGADKKDLVQDSSVMLNSFAVTGEKGDGNELEDSSEFDSPFDIPCGQRVMSQQSSNSSEEPASVTDGSGENGRERSSDERSSSSEGGKRSVEEVQLEYEMPEISLSQFESSVTEILGTPSKMDHSGTEMAHCGTKMASGHGNIPSDGTKIPTLRRAENAKRTSTPFRGGCDELQMEQNEDDVFVALDSSLVCLTASQRRDLLQKLCSASGDSGEQDEEVGEGEEGEGLCESETEDEEEWRSGQWSTQPLTIPERLDAIYHFSCPVVHTSLFSPPEHQDSEACINQLDGPIAKLGSSIDDSISQLDGTPDYPKTSMSIIVSFLLR